MVGFPDMVRNVAVVGHLHHGKTALMDMLVFETHKLIWDADKPVIYSRFSRHFHYLLSIDTIHGHARSFETAGNFDQILPHVSSSAKHRRKIFLGTPH